MDKDLQKIFYESDSHLLTCPDCKGHEFLQGPRGGMSTNIKCNNPSCGSEFNVCPEFRLIERI